MKPRIRIGGEISPGTHVATIERDGEQKTVAVRESVDGQPVFPDSEVAHIDKPDADGWQTITTLYRSGPAQVATPKYREGYDRIFGKRAEVGVA